MWLAVVLGVVPLVGWLLWWWNDIWYELVTASLRSSKAGATKLPPGYMGLPIIGEMFTFLWYFKILRRPDDYINSKRRKYGDGIGIYRTHLFSRPSVIVFSPAATTYVFRAEKSFVLEWPNVEIVGKSSLVAVHGKTHARLRSFVSRSINQPEALRRIAETVQPRMISALESWAKLGTINSYKEIKKVTFENIGMYFASFEPGPTLDILGKSFIGLVSGVRSYPLNIPGFAYHHGLQCRKKAVAIFRGELEKRKKNDENGSTRGMNDLMDGFMKLKDEEGSQLSDIEILDNIISVLVAGYESTTLATMWAVYYLAKYPKVLQKLRDILYQKDGMLCYGLGTSTQILTTSTIQCLSTLIDGMHQWRLEHTKCLVADQEFVQEICLLVYNSPSFSIICPQDTRGNWLIQMQKSRISHTLNHKMVSKLRFKSFDL